MRVLFLTRSLHLGGAESQLVSTACGLRDRGNGVAVAVFYEGGRLWAEARGRGLECHSIGKRGRWDMAATFVRLARLVRAIRPDVIYSFLQGANITLGLARPILGRPAIVWGVRASNMLFNFYGGEANILLRAECLLSGVADAVICNSQSGAEFYAEHGVDPERLHVIQNGIDCEEFQRDAAAGRSIRQQVGSSESAQVVGVVGRIDPIKDHATAFEACRLLIRQGHDIEIWVVGDGPSDYVDALKQSVERIGLQHRVKWLGVRRDMRAVYSALDVLVSASLSEGFPNVVAEAAACGTPCVVTDVGDSSAIIGDIRYVVPPSSVARMSKALEVALSAESGRGESWRSRIIGRFDRQGSITRTETLLRQIVDARAGWRA